MLEVSKPVIELPEREKPVEAMGECPTFPYLPEDFGTYAPDALAKLLALSFIQSMKAYEICERKRQGLIDWINNTPYNPEDVH